MADSNRVKILVAEESSFGVSPGAGGTWATARVVNDSLKQDTDFLSSDEIRTLRDIRDMDRVERGVTGSLNGYLFYDNTYQAAMQKIAVGSAGWSTENSVVAAAACTTDGANEIALDTGSWANTPSVGSWIYVSGAANAATNGFHKVTAATANTIDTETTLGGAESGVSLTIIEMAAINNGTTFTSLAIQRGYNDLSNQHALYLGCGVNGFQMEANGPQRVSMNYDIVGVQEQSDTSGGETADTAAASTKSMIARNGTQWVREAGVEMDTLSMTLNVSQNLRSRYKLGQFGPMDMKLGDFVVTGTLQAYFSDEAMIDKYLNGTETSLAIAISDEVTARGNAYLFDLPRIQFTSGQRVAGGRNQDVIADMGFQAVYDSVDACSLRIARIASA